MTEVQHIVDAGTEIVYPSGQTLEVTNTTAVCRGSDLYCTQLWLDRAAKTKADWEGRSWWRKFWGMEPKGYPAPQSQPLIPEWLWPFQ